MGKYFITQITKTKDSDVYATAVTVLEDDTTLFLAKSTYYSIQASVFATPNVEHSIVRLDNASGGTIAMDTIIPEQPEPEPEEA